MKVFVVFNVTRAVDVETAIKEHFPSDNLPLLPGSWLVAGEAAITAKDIGDALGVTAGENGNAIIVPMDAYWGRAPSSVWEWIGAKRAQTVGG